MKRRGWVFEEVVEMDNLRLAYWKARRGKEYKKEVLMFSKPSLEANLMALRQSIIDGIPPVGQYHCFRIYEPKERLVIAAGFPERILHHALMNVCEKDFEKYQTCDSYACRKNKGVHAALEKAYDNHRHFRYCVKLDVRKYFESISHDILIRQLCRLYKDPKLLEVFFRILECYEVTPSRGLPIGNLTSQHLANHYLGTADHFAKEHLHVPAYVRYMDDIMMWGDNRELLMSQARSLRDLLHVRLSLNLKVFTLSSTHDYVAFLGYRLSKYGFRLSSASSHRYINNVKELFKKYDSGLVDDVYIFRHLQTAIDFINKASSDGIKRKAMDIVYL